MTLPSAVPDDSGHYVRCPHCSKRLTIVVEEHKFREVWLDSRWWSVSARSRVWRRARSRRPVVSGATPAVGWLPNLPAPLTCDNPACRRNMLLETDALRLRPKHRYSVLRACAEPVCPEVVEPPARYCAAHGGPERRVGLGTEPPGLPWPLTRDADKERWRALMQRA